MTFNIERLPQQILGEILRPLVTQGSSELQLSVLSVSSVFYLAAIPILYHSVLITNRPDSFFLHCDQAPDASAEELPYTQFNTGEFSAELFRNGKTKLAAMRFVRKLSIIFPEPVQPLPAPAAGVGEAIFEDVEEEALQRRIRQAQISLTTLPFGVLDNLEVYRMGDVRHYRGLEMENSQAFIQAFDRTFEPAGPFVEYTTVHTLAARTVCQHASLRSMPSRVADTDPSRSRPTSHIHTHALELTMIPACGLTYIHLHPRHTDDANARFLGLLQESWQDLRERQAKWLVVVFGSASEATKDQSYPSTIIIAGLLRPLLPVEDGLSSDAESGESEKQGDVEVKQGKEIVDRARLIAKEKGIEHADDIIFEVRSAKDMPACPTCGLSMEMVGE